MIVIYSKNNTIMKNLVNTKGSNLDIKTGDGIIYNYGKAVMWFNCRGNNLFK